MTAVLIALIFGLRYLTTSLDVSVSNSLRRSVFLNILKQSPRLSPPMRVFLCRGFLQPAHPMSHQLLRFRGMI